MKYDCIFCHAQIYEGGTVGTRTFDCEKCRVWYIVFGGQIHCVRFNPVDGYQINMWVQENRTTYSNNQGEALSLNRMFWVFPHNVSHLNDKFKKLLPIS